MKKLIFLLVVLFVFSGHIVLASSSKPAPPPPTQAKSAIILAHGMAANEKIFGLIDYFYKVKGWLEDKGWTVYQTGDSVSQWNSATLKGMQFAKVFYTEILPQAKAKFGNDVKFHIIGHSHGCLYTRYAISNGSPGVFNNSGCGEPINVGYYPPIAPYVISHTSLCGPHRGSTTCDVLYNNRDNIPGLLADILNMPIIEDVLGWIGVDLVDDVLQPLFTFLDGTILEQGDVCVLQNAINLSTYGANYLFNPYVPDIPNVKYQSWASTVTSHNPVRTIDLAFNPTYGYMKHPTNGHKVQNSQNLAKLLNGSLDLNATLTFGGHNVKIASLLEGANDGLVDEDSAKWGTYRGLIKGNSFDSAYAFNPLFTAFVVGGDYGGVDHFQINNNLLDNTPGFDPKDFWVNKLLPTINEYNKL